MGLTPDGLAQLVKTALEDADLDGIFGLLAPDVRWGPPDDPVSGCHDRDEVRAWYQAAFDRGIRATVTEMLAGDECLLVGLSVSGSTADGDPGGQSERWQVLGIRDGLIADIRGYDNRPDAAARAGIAP